MTGYAERLVLVSEGFCPRGHGLLTPWDHFGQLTGACFACRCSYRVGSEDVWVAACVPGDHTCARTS